MITVTNVLLIFVWALVYPFILGFLGSFLLGRREGFSIAENFCFGFAIELAVFYVLAVPMIYLRTSYTMLKTAWLICINILMILSLLYIYRNRSILLKSLGAAALESGGLDKLTVAVWVLFLLMVLFQTGLLTLRMHMDTDDARFVAEALEPLERDTMLAYNPVTGEYDANEVNNKQPGMPVGEMYKDMSSPYPIYLGLVSDLFDLNPAIVAHTVLPALLIPLSYLVFYLAGVYVLSGDRKKIGIFLLFLSVIHLFSFETTFAPGYTLLNVIWQGRSIAAMILLPLLWATLMRTGTAEGVQGEPKTNFVPYIKSLVILFALNCACACLSGTGAVIALILCTAYALVRGIVNRSLPWLFVIGLGMAPAVFCILYGDFVKEMFYFQSI